MKRNNSGISLIVLVITVIVMIILAGSVIISLSNSGIIGKANEAVDANNLKQVEQLAALAWSEAYIDKMTDSTVDLKARVEAALEKNKVDQTKYVINVTDSGVSVKAKTTLGALVASAEDYGKKVDYTVTVDGKEHKDWKVLYEDEVNGYVFIISNDSVESTSLDEGVTVASLSATEKELYNKFQVGSWPKYTLIEDEICQAVAQLIKNYAGYANITEYGSNVIGAIGGPTLQLIAESWNAQGKNPEMTLTAGYMINGELWFEVPSYDFLMPADCYYWLASPSANGGVYQWTGYSLYCDLTNYRDSSTGVRPVVCISSNIPAYEGDGVDFSLVQQGE